MPYVLFTVSDSALVGSNGTLSGSILGLASDTLQAALFGEFSIEAEWDAYVKNLKTMGVEQLISIYQSYIDRYYAD